jgi:hypothetical protein
LDWARPRSEEVHVRPEWDLDTCYAGSGKIDDQLPLPDQ